MVIEKGDRVYLKGKYGMSYDVAVESVNGEYATVKGDITFGTKKIKLN
ncbi:hypothetical protein [Clostridium akagii]|nr:hypothetical protein [Clostridium akagii]